MHMYIMYITSMYKCVSVYFSQLYKLSVFKQSNMHKCRMNELKSLDSGEIFRECNGGMFSTIVILRFFVPFVRCLPLL